VIRFKILGSGSSGNATVVQARGGRLTHLLVDCGLGIRELDKRLGAAGMLAEQIDAIFITHEHADHIGCARQLALRERIPVYMSDGTYARIGEPDFGGCCGWPATARHSRCGACRCGPSRCRTTPASRCS
jgi:phosphoribosyl 1,2-cyclic phosphodiesterase